MWMVRHGESNWNALDLVQGQAPGPVLTARGRRQAGAAARFLAGAPVGAVVSSDLDRAQSTAEPIARALDLPLRTDGRLRERALGEAEGRPVSMLTTEWSGIGNARVVDAGAAPPGGESVADFYRRVVGCVEELLGPGGGLEPAVPGEPVIVAHGGVVRVLLGWIARTGAGSPAGAGLDG
ncbi:MAG: histidine phosphatase family protein, partial [Acidimicrobiales bacterium]